MSITYFPILFMYYEHNIVRSYLSDLVAASFHITCIGYSHINFNINKTVTAESKPRNSNTKLRM